MCHSRERHRFSWVFLHEKISLFKKPGTKFLHIAPERFLAKVFKTKIELQYFTTALDNPHVDLKADITRFPSPSNTFDIIYCSHVLEHIPNDEKAMEEIFRLLKPEGIAIIMVPIQGKKTYEDFSKTTPEERKKAFGQWDHVRIYGMDIIDRLKNAGLKISIHTCKELTENAETKKMNLWEEDLLFVCRK